MRPLPVVEKVEERWDDETGESTARLRDLVLDETDMWPSETLEVERNDSTARGLAFVLWRFAEREVWEMARVACKRRRGFEGEVAGVSISGERLRLEEICRGGRSGDSGVSTSICALFSAISFSIRARRLRGFFLLNRSFSSNA